MTNPLVVPSTEDQSGEDPLVEEVDRIVRALIHAAPASLVAVHEPDSEAIRWQLRRNHNSQSEEIARSPQNMFRSCLAYLGNHYLAGQLYAGYARRLLACGNRRVACAFFVSNEALSGLWMRAYAAPVD